MNLKLLHLPLFFLLFLANYSNGQVIVTHADGIATESLGPLFYSVTLNYTVPAGTDRMLLVSAGSEKVFSSVTFDGVAMNLISPDPPINQISMWTLALGNSPNPTPGDIVFTVTDDEAQTLYMGINAISFAGVDQTTPVDGYMEGVIPADPTETTSSLTIASRPGDMVYTGVAGGCIICGVVPAILAESGQTIENVLVFFGTVYQAAGYGGTLPGAASVDMAWSFDAFGVPGLQSGVNVRAAEPDSPTPVELTTFTARERNKNVVLNWETQSEINNEKFEIQRSKDGRDFIKIGEVSGNGTSAASHTYQFIDRSLRSATTYYRLKQMDFDGAYEYSKVVAVQSRQKEFSIFPNPTTGTLYIENFDGAQGTVQLNIYDQTGRLVHRYELADSQYTLDISNLVKGVYTVEINSNQGSTIEKLVKL